MIVDEMKLRPRYGEVDQMGYVYHANYVSYCHQARTEMFRKLGVNDKVLEENDTMLPVISFDIKYKQPVRYDELLTIKTSLLEMPQVRVNFKFEIFNERGELTTQASSTVVFVDKQTRMPKLMPEFVGAAIDRYLKSVCS